MSTEPLVSIVVPVYNSERFLNDAINSVQNQTYHNWELLLIDDSSTDKSIDVIKRFVKVDNRIKLVCMKSNSGAALARNAGIRLAKGKYLAFLDADDVWVKSKLKRQLTFMQKHEYAFTFTGYEFADERCVATGKKVSVPATITYRQALKNHIIWTSTVMIDLTKVNKKNVFMPDIRRGQDAATWWMILRHVGTAHGIDVPLSYYRRTIYSLSANKYNAMKRTWYLFTNVEKLSFAKSVYYFVWYGYNAIKKRV